MGRSAPDLENLALLAELFSCTVDEPLIGDAEAPDGAPREARPADAADGRGRTGAEGRAPSEAASRQVGPTPSETERIARDNRCIACAFCSMRTIIWHLRYQRSWDPLEDLGDPLGRRPH